MENLQLQLLNVGRGERVKPDSITIDRVDNPDSQKGRTAGAPQQRCCRIPRARARGYQPSVAPRRKIITEEPQRGERLVAWSGSSGQWEPPESVAPEERPCIAGDPLIVNCQHTIALINTPIHRGAIERQERKNGFKPFLVLISRYSPD